MKQLVSVLVILVAAVVAARIENIKTLEKLYKPHPSTSRIINGHDAREGQFPWQVHITMYKSLGVFNCGGSLIHKNWVLTAAHCAKGASKFDLKFGGLTLNPSESGRVDVVATTYCVHPEYRKRTSNNDIALIYMNTPVKLGRRISTIRLPAPGRRIGVSEMVTVSGWGKTSDGSGVSNKLKYVDLITIDNDDCTQYYGAAVVEPSTLCCEGRNKKSTCYGDSGGPLVAYEASGPTQVGIVSFGTDSGCANGIPTGYMRTESYLNWIYKTINGFVGTCS